MSEGENISSNKEVLDPAEKSSPLQNETCEENEVSPNGRRTGQMKAGDVTECGFGVCRPQALQSCNNPKVFIAWISWFAFVQGFVCNGVNNLNTTTIEKRFNLPSSKVGLISSIYDIAAGIFVIPVTLYGSIGHQPRLLALAAFFLCLGTFIMSLPHYVTELYELGDPIAEHCDLSANGSLVDCEGNLSNYLYIFLLGQFLNGIGGTTLYTLGYVYIDSNVSTKSSPIYQGIILTFSTLGPAAGYLLGGYMLSYYVDFDKVDVSKLSITDSDPRWVGAWWVCFLIASFLFITVILAMYPYPRLMPAGVEAQASRVSEAHNDGSEAVVSRDDFLTSWSDVMTSFRYLLTNPVLVFVTCGVITEGIGLSGFATFLPKIIQNQFLQTSSWSALLAGFIVVPSAAVGNLSSSLIMRWMKLKVAGMLRLCIVICVICILLVICMLCRCDSARLAGLTELYPGTIDLGLNSSCNVQCGCSTQSYEPVCGVDSIQYFSSCHAGCHMSFTHEGTKMFSNCSCIMHEAGELGQQAHDGPCSEDCNKMNIFLVFFFFVIMVTFMVQVPSISVILRSLPDKQRLLGLGVKSVFVRFLGTVPGPLLFGKVFDVACVQWQEICEHQGSCWVYDNDQLSNNLLILAIVLKFCSSLFFSIALCFYKPPPDYSLEQMEGLENKGYTGESNNAVENHHYTTTSV